MGGSTPNLTSVADFITKTSDEDGVAYALNKFLNWILTKILQTHYKNIKFKLYIYK